MILNSKDFPTLWREFQRSNAALAFRRMTNIGATLREARTRAQIDISEVETQTKIRAKYLRAIENEQWDLLPGPVYVKSFLRTYGDFLGLDSRLLVDEYKRRYELPAEYELRPATSLRRERERATRGPRGPLLPSWALIALVLVAIVVALYALGSGSRSTSSSPNKKQAGAAQHHKHRASHTRTTQTAAPAPQPTTVKLELVPTATVYVCLVNGSGTALIPGKIFTPGDTIPTETADKLLLTLGNASVQMKVNGKPVHVGASSSSIGYLLQPSGSQPLPATKQPRCA